jgi:energy-coupling factor transporter ATP-binding protein EcfA2
MRARDNPFSVGKVLNVRYVPQSTTWEDLLDRLQALDFRAAIVGPEGSGKTTLLEDLAAILSKRFDIRWFSLSEDSEVPEFDEITTDDLVFVDSTHLLDRRRWRRLLSARTRGLVVTAHTPTRLPTLIRCSTSIALLDGINNRLIGEQSNEIHELSQKLFAKYHGNVRDVLRKLYDIWAAQV